MLSRRELITVGVAGSVTATPGAVPARLLEEQQAADREGQREIARTVQAFERSFTSAFLSNSLGHGFVGKLRADMEQFMRANQKFPDFFDIGSLVFFDVYDWHVKNQQQIVVTRIDSRYAIQFMFSALILRPEQDRSYIGIPYDRG